MTGVRSMARAASFSTQPSGALNGSSTDEA